MKSIIANWYHFNINHFSICHWLVQEPTHVYSLLLLSRNPKRSANFIMDRRLLISGAVQMQLKFLVNCQCWYWKWADREELN